MVPDDNFYRQVEQSIDLGFVSDLADEFYSSIGRPSIDPVVFFKLQLIAFFEGIRSERQLMETVNLNLAHRWFIGYDLDEPVPDHSSLSKIRERYGLEIFQQFFEHIVELCIEAGLVENASGFGKLVAKYNDERLSGIQEPHYHSITDDQVCPVDPDAAPMHPSGGGSAVLGYCDHYVVDGGKSRIILSALVTPASIMDNTPILDLVDWVCSRWKIEPKLAVGDARYGRIPKISGFEKRGIKTYLPTPDFSNRTKHYPAKLFEYDPENNHYICPKGKILPLRVRRKKEQILLYKSKAEVCNVCPVKVECTGSKSGRYISRSFYQEYIDKAEVYRQNEDYQKAMRKRSVWVEPLFGEAKEFHRLRSFRLRRLLKVNIEGVMIAAGQNLKRLIKHNLSKLFSFLKTVFLKLNFHPSSTFSTGW